MKVPLLIVVTLLSVGASPPLLLQVEWILQGFDWSFTGFFVEFMGLTRALRDEFPLLNVQRSSFRTGSSIEDGANYPPSDFVADLFEEEAYFLGYLANHTVPMGSPQLAAAPAPRSLFMPPFVAAEDACRPSEDFNEGVQVVGGDLSRSTLTSPSAHECCEACRSLPICLAWSFDLGASECKLKGTAPAITVSTPLHSSGVIKGSLAGGSPAKTARVPSPKALILHGTTCIYKNESFAAGGLAKRDINTILIGRFMLERSAFTNGLDINEYSVLSCASIVDEIWVPTEWGVGVMRSLLAIASVTNKRIAVVPEAVDTRLFDPALASDAALEERSRRGVVPASCQWIPAAEMGQEENAEAEVAAYGGAHTTYGRGASSLACPQPSAPSISSSSSKSSSRSKFEFLSIFKWERRKGWDILLRAYFRAFSPHDDVRLRLRTYVPSFLGGDLNITSRIEEFALAATGSTLQQLPEVVWERGADEAERENGMSREEVRDLYFLADCFVLPTRGEGWGLPVAEAMAMGLPVIVTNYSGPAAYATEENAYPLPVLLEFDHEHYAVPDEDALVLLLRQVVSDSLSSTSSSGSGSGSRSDEETQAQVEARRRGQRARETMQRNFSATHVAEIMKQRLRQEVSARGWEA